MPERNPTLRNRLPFQWIILGIALLILGAVLGVNLYLEYGRTGTREQERLFTQARVIEKNLAWNLNSVNQVLASLQKERSLVSSDRDIGVTPTFVQPSIKLVSSTADLCANRIFPNIKLS